MASTIGSLVNTKFASVQQFQEHFIQHDELVIEPGQNLIIRNLPAFATDHLPLAPLQQLISIIDCLILPLVRKVSILHSKDINEINLKVNLRGIGVKFSTRWKISLLPTSDPFFSRLDHLFQMMIFSKQLCIKIAPFRDWIWTDATPEERTALKGDDTGEYIDEILNKRVPLHYDLEVESTSADSNTDISYRIGEKSIAFSTKQGIEISLLKEVFFSHPEAFLKEMVDRGSLELRYPEQMVICCSELEDLVQKSHHVMNGPALNRLGFILNQMTLPFEKFVKLSCSGKIFVSNDHNRLTFRPDKNSVITLTLNSNKIEPVHFKAVHEFQEYFKTHEELLLGAGQQLIIEQVQFLAGDDSRKNFLATLVNTFSRLLAPIGRSVFCRTSVNLEANSDTFIKQINRLEKIEVSFPEPWEIRLSPKNVPIIIGAKSLFEMMVFSGQLELEIAPSQPLILTDLGENELKNIFAGNKIIEKLHDRLNKELPPGYNLFFTESQGALTNYDLTDGELKITSSERLKISIKKPRFYPDPAIFIQEILKTGQITFRDDERFELSSEDFIQFEKDYDQSSSRDFSRLEFILSQRAAYLGKTIEICYSAESFNWNRKNNKVFFEPEKGTSMRLILKDKDIFTSIKTLQKDLFSRLPKDGSAYRDLIYTPLNPHQKVTFYGFSERELTYPSRKENLLKSIGDLFFKYSTNISFKLALHFNGNVGLATITSTRQDGTRIFDLELNPNEAMKIALVQVINPTDLATQVINLSSPMLLNGLLESDYNAMAMLLFRVFYQILSPLYSEINDDGIKNLLEQNFKVEVVQKITQLRASDAFKLAFQQVQTDPVLQAALAQLFALTPDEFSEIDLSQLEPELKVVFKEIKALENLEFQGGAFLMKVIDYLIKSIKTDMSDFGVRFLVHPLPESELEEEKGNA